MNALEIIKDVVEQTGITEVPSTLVGTTDPQIINLKAILNRIGRLLVSRNQWNVLGNKFSFASTGGNPQAEPLPTDWRTSLSNASVWRSGSLLVPLSGPCPPDVWHRLLTLPGIRFPGYWREFAGNLEIIGAPLDETLTIEYVGNGWVVGADGVPKNKAELDDDTFKFSDDLLILGTIYQWRANKSMPFAQDMADFEYKLEQDIAADRAARPISTTWPYRPDVELRTWPGIVVPSGGIS